MVIPTIVGTDPAELDTLLNTIGDAANADIGALQNGAGRGTLANYSVSNLSALQALVPSMSTGDTAIVTTASTGIGRVVWVRNNDAPSVEPIGPIVAATKANMTSYISTVSALSRVKFVVGGKWTDVSTRIQYRFTSTAGAYVPVNDQVIYPASVSGTGATVGDDGVIQWTNGTSGSPLTIDGWFPTDFKVFRLRVTGLLSAGISSPTVVLRTTAPADNTSSNYAGTEIIGRNGGTTSSGPATGSSWSFPAVSRAYQLEGTFYGVNAASPTSFLFSAGSVELPQASSNANLVLQKFNTHNVSTAMGGMKFTVPVNFSGTFYLAVEGLY